MPLHFLQLYQSTLGELIAEWLGRASGCVCVSLCVCLSVVDVPLREGVNPLILNQADVLAHHSLSSRPLLPGSLLLNLQASAKCCSISFPVCFGLLSKISPGKLSKAARQNRRLQIQKISYLHSFAAIYPQLNSLS